MAALLRGVFIIGAKRTPFGTFGGKLRDLTATRLGAIASRAALENAGIKPDEVNSVTFGTVLQASSRDGPYISRHVALSAGVPESVPCLTVNRLCGSGFQSIITGSQEICLREAEVVLAGGAENMSQAPYAVRDIRFGTKFGTDYKLEDTLWSSVYDTYVDMPMAITAENLATKYKISREECDKFALLSQNRWKQAQDNNRFSEELVSVAVVVKGKDSLLEVDEHPRPQTTMEGLAKLKPVFKKGGVVTAGNASGICDGAAAVVLASEEYIKAKSLKPLARIVGYSYVGVDPTIMGIGPADAIRKLCDNTGIKIQDVDIIDINEAFASQFLAVQKELNLDPAKTNVNGGAIALGHPVGASGSRITANLVYELRARKAKYAIGSACIGGGQGIAIMLENIN
ncbi:3-ketoacyl-CoA thiolase, mitochondrial [Parasteatoda tepidariorum]|uniref:3-ketoacyl-CoA thiolase, mitochondrial n=1 Tax=Parasteatoda tepidariorum TaxID=114398 RepID=UPI00077F8ED0|nr:3-ketoacyl-CoA thiolase, mitochondrial [Parasteatoda tepidariorum]XP_042896990.1 3-ketoacyl-CoA thiolase, mitochondrial [Parasteatoda tepidariorum]XP_042896991.1 3-ketoacyl-CoA thiolase, mitochondrial [Parasteatoda tepidariorum]